MEATDVLTPGNTRRFIRIHGATRKEALAKLTEKIAASNRGLPVPSAHGSVAAYVTYWLDAVAVHQLRTTCQCCVRGLDTARDEPLCCTTGNCFARRLSPLTRAYVHSVLKSAPGARGTRG
ncbi:hypothetical protein [Streptomyces sp. R33]|uniref:Uncharacterized protein n=1 Tax=Streptomyces sp. R33 TaxID=3238629 RepID=A0AB39YCI6_9ACTN